MTYPEEFNPIPI